MDAKHARDLFEKHNIDNVRVVHVDLNGTARGKRLPANKFLSLIEDARPLSFCAGTYSLTPGVPPAPDLPFVGGAAGFPDRVLRPDLGTLTVIPWEERTAWVICDMIERDGGEVAFDPRTVLKGQIGRIAARSLQVRAALEYEFYVLRETHESLREANWSNLQTFFVGTGCYDQVRSNKARFFMEDIWRLLPQAGIPLDSMQVEMGGGMFEFPIKEADPLKAADRAVLFKVGVKEICHRHGLVATFMAKIGPEFEGLSGAVHHSLVDEQGNNLFYDADRGNCLSETMELWAEGILQNLLDMTLILVPTYNSYKRPVPGSFVANSTTWAIESRGTTLRFINFDPESTRIENRLPGADANPYLVLAAHLAAGLYGLEKQVPLRPPFVGADPSLDRANRDDVEYIPKSLESAIARFRASSRMREFFGPQFCEIFAAHRAYDLEQAYSRIAAWERERYLEDA